VGHDLNIPGEDGGGGRGLPKLTSSEADKCRCYDDEREISVEGYLDYSIWELSGLCVMHVYISFGGLISRKVGRSRSRES